LICSRNDRTCGSRFGSSATGGAAWASAVPEAVSAMAAAAAAVLIVFITDILSRTGVEIGLGQRK
jgi:hypothetical protein